VFVEVSMALTQLVQNQQVFEVLVAVILEYPRELPPQTVAMQRIR
jgi:hypothetical protein